MFIIGLILQQRDNEHSPWFLSQVAQYVSGWVNNTGPSLSFLRLSEKGMNLLLKAHPGTITIPIGIVQLVCTDMVFHSHKCRVWQFCHLPLPTHTPLFSRHSCDQRDAAELVCQLFQHQSCFFDKEDFFFSLSAQQPWVLSSHTVVDNHGPAVHAGFCLQCHAGNEPQRIVPCNRESANDSEGP